MYSQCCARGRNLADFVITVRATLKEGETPLWVRPGSGENSIRVAIFGLLPVMKL